MKLTQGTQPDHDVVIIGSGFAGLGMAIQLKRAGRDDFLILEQADSVGGTWRDNHYPGCACDIQSHLYSFSFDPNPDWSRMFARQPEIHDYLERTATGVGAAAAPALRRRGDRRELDEETGLWHITVNGERDDHRPRGGERHGRPVQPLLRPRCPGLEGFKGASFHSASGTTASTSPASGSP